MVRLDSDLFHKATQLAQSEDRPLSYFIRRAVKHDVEMRWRKEEWPIDPSLDFEEGEK
jgi:predicted transcriptional regulator